MTDMDGCSSACIVEAGWDCAGMPTVCTDIDQCTEQTDNCDSNATCMNIPGTFLCMCNSGFTGDGLTCSDINECLMTPCDPNAACVNSPGSYTCTCNAGFTGNGLTCSDINECATNNGGCNANATRTSTPGSRNGLLPPRAPTASKRTVRAEPGLGFTEKELPCAAILR